MYFLLRREFRMALLIFQRARFAIRRRPQSNARQKMQTSGGRNQIFTAAAIEYDVMTFHATGTFLFPG